MTDHKGRDTSSQESVDKVRIPLDTQGVHGVVASSKRDDATPRDGETVSLDAIRL